MVLRGIWAKCLLYWIGVWSKIGGGPLTDSAMIGLAARIVLSQTHEVLNTDSSWSPGFTNIYTQLENVTILRWNSYSHTMFCWMQSYLLQKTDLVCSFGWYHHQGLKSNDTQSWNRADNGWNFAWWGVSGGPRGIITMTSVLMVIVPPWRWWWWW